MDMESWAEPPSVTLIQCQRSAVPQNAVTVPCRTQGNERKVGVIKRKVSPQNILCISPLATSLPSFSKCWGFQAEEIISQSYLSWGSSNAVRTGKGKSCAHPSVMIGYQNPSGIREWIREGKTWSRDFSKRQETPTCPFTCSINRGFSSEGANICFIYFPPNSQITKSKPTEGTFRHSYLRILFYAINLEYFTFVFFLCWIWVTSLKVINCCRSEPDTTVTCHSTTSDFKPGPDPSRGQSQWPVFRGATVEFIFLEFFREIHTEFSCTSCGHITPLHRSNSSCFISSSKDRTDLQSLEFSLATPCPVRWMHLISLSWRGNEGSGKKSKKMENNQS